MKKLNKKNKNVNVQLRDKTSVITWEELVIVSN